MTMSIFPSTRYPVVGWAINGHIAQTHIVIIDSGAAISGMLDMTEPELYGYTPMAVITPAAWDTAKLSVQGSLDKTTWFDIHLWQEEYDTKHNVSANECHIMSEYPLRGIPYLRFRSGTAAAPVNQTATRNLTIICGTT